MTEELSRELVAALNEEHDGTDAYAVERARVRARLAAVIPAFGSAPLGAPGVPDAMEPAARAGSAAGRVATSKVALAWLAPAFVVGAIAVAASDHVHVARTTPATPGRRAPAAATSVVAQSAEPVKPLPVEPLQTAASPSPLPRNTARAPSATVNDRTLAAEQQLLDAARGAIARGTPAVGLSLLEVHALRFPSGQLTEEREALYVRILMSLGRYAEATSRAASFHRRFPSSLFAPVVDAALDAISRRNGDAGPKP